jgi:hypothetical protein
VGGEIGPNFEKLKMPSLDMTGDLYLTRRKRRICTAKREVDGRKRVFQTRLTEREGMKGVTGDTHTIIRTI